MSRTNAIYTGQAQAPFDPINETSANHRRRRSQVLGGHDTACEPPAFDPERISRLLEKEHLAHRLEQILDTMPAGVVMLDGDGVVQQCNAVAVDLLGSPLLGVSWREVINRAFQGRPFGPQMSLVDGRVVRFSMSPLGGEPGEIILLQDISESHRIQEIFHRQRRLCAIGEMVAALAHQIRTPLTSGMLYLNHLERQSSPSAEQSHSLERVKSCFLHMEQLVKEMLAFAKGGAMAAESVAMTIILQDLANLVEPLMKPIGTKFQIENLSRDAKIFANKDAIITVLQSLVINAHEAFLGSLADKNDCSNAGAYRILVHTVCLQGSGVMDAIEISVSDNGPGISEEIQPHIFEPFITTKPQGTGLGLAIAKAIVQSHQGALWLDRSSASGSTFKIRLPATYDNPDPTKKKARSSKSGARK